MNRGWLVAVITAAVLVLVVPLGMLAVPLMFMSTSGADQNATTGGSCVGQQWNGQPPTEVGNLTQAQLDLARTIWDVAHQSGFGADATQAAVIGIATAMQESTLGANPATQVPNADDDAGPFQIRVRLSWHAETLAQALDPVYSATVFFQGKLVTADEHRRAVAAKVQDPLAAGYRIPGLAQVEGWQQMSVTEAAQQVQRSAFPTAYAKHETLARVLVAELSNQPAGPMLCGNTDTAATGCPATGLAAENGLTPDGLRVFRCVTAKWPQLTSFSTVREDSLPYHPSGRAVDFMIPGWDTPAGNQLGWQIATWLQTNATTYGVDHVIFDRQIWSAGRASEGWRPCSAGSCYAGPDPTAAHEDHVHVTVYGDRGVPGPTTGVVLPVAGYTLTARFGQCGDAWVNCHTGLDFAAATGTRITAVAAGRVTFAGWSGAYGNLVILDHGSGVSSYYAHQSHISAQVGQQLQPGAPIGRVGQTGNTNGPHLHFEIRINGSPTDPARWLTSKGLTP